MGDGTEYFFGFTDYLQELIDYQCFDGECCLRTIVEIVIESGIEVLPEKQAKIFEEEVLNHYVVKECIGPFCGGSDIPWEEMYEAIETSMCSYCAYKTQKVQDE